jgi:hypothetical protein
MTFGFTKTYNVLVLLGADQNLSPELFFFSHEQKHQQKLASPIADENRHKIAFWYNTYIRQKKNLKKSFGRLQGPA